MKWYILSAVQLADLKSLLGRLDTEEPAVAEREKVVATARGILEDISQLTVVANL